MNWDKITKDEKVKQLLIDRAYIEEEIKRLDENALIMYELEVLSIPDVVGQSEQFFTFTDWYFKKDKEIAEALRSEFEYWLKNKGK